MLGDARALDARELVRLVVLTERAAAPERRCVHVQLPARDLARLPDQRDALALRRDRQRGKGACWKQHAFHRQSYTSPHVR